MRRWIESGDHPPVAALTDSDGTLAVRYARRALELRLGAPDGSLAGTLPATAPPIFALRRGVFVTLRTAVDGELRGCIGFPLPNLPLGRAIDDAALAAAAEDPRFPPVGPEELADITIEVSALTPPERLDPIGPEELLARVRIGTDGLIVEGEGSGGLLLPQVAVEQHWSPERFLAGTCEKAGLAPGRWRNPGLRWARFQSQVFGEETPGGPVRRRLG
ncbi:MAG TPA: TIGR00296 family protein [Thermoplasmata archaeon]|nr:TIGR00296 family protein [Thermoplasmata archaeon]